jgi:hypothetical protein
VITDKSVGFGEALSENITDKINDQLTITQAYRTKAITDPITGLGRIGKK